MKHYSIYIYKKNCLLKDDWLNLKVLGNDRFCIVKSFFKIKYMPLQNQNNSIHFILKMNWDRLFIFSWLERQNRGGNKKCAYGRPFNIFICIFLKKFTISVTEN